MSNAAYELMQQSPAGNRGNQQYMPTFVKYCLQFSKLLPLCTSIMVPHFPQAPVLSSSASIESSFNNIKNKTFVKLPMRIDKFLFHHINDMAMDGQIKIAYSSTYLGMCEYTA